MLIFYIVLCCVVAYLLGSIPSAIWVGKKFYNIDVREHGSKNAGATNTFRVLGKKAGIPVLIFDILKGFAAVQLVQLLPLDSFSTDLLISLNILLGACAVLGHIFPVFANFKGGKGVATVTGVVAAIHPLAWLVSTIVFLIALLISRYVSLSSMIAAITFPIIIVFVLPDYSRVLDIFSIGIAFLIIATHRKNIERLIKKEESRVNFGSKK
ncbi:MAG: glycerol-3-phosphate 1-O-acyltransferase PlsY [Bacteroidia bacterium]|nr:glycerol-3-phosphate 1-O-acyltransferase PlsY [Bacteroidia bacterium]NNC86060.1 glycerol-3-phosphate 1-O-acyltransferase PlsY [Bacteroidia bacterium]